jgi:hypothetical protein
MTTLLKDAKSEVQGIGYTECRAISGMLGRLIKVRS